MSHPDRALRAPRPMTAAFVAAIALTSALLLSAPARADYCGPVADTRAIEKLTMDHTLPDRTRIQYLAVVDSFAMSTVEWKGQQSLYFEKTNGDWTYAGAFPPSNLPADTKKRFDEIINTYGRGCLNPNFVNHPSGP